MAGRSEVGPTALRMMLGAHLRRLRERAGVSRSDAGWAIRGSESKISRIELGRVGFKERDIADLLDLYGLTDEAERERLVQLARDANDRGWWHRYGDVTPDWFDAYLGLEAAADLIRTYELQFVPGLLQTADYARAVARLGNDRSAAEIDRVVALRQRRQQVLDRDPPLRLWAVIEEAALLRPIGGVAVLRGQLVALRESIERPNITVQILPVGSPGHPATGGAFSILRFPQADLPDIVYLEHLTSALYLDKRDDIEAYTQILDLLAGFGPAPQDAGRQLTALLDRLAG